ncbi:YqgE/AlgH family protein [Salaquimonas pukyongi]|uniref:YqgE/AlgH family protein n=1 Tax=Salaquimonas pukyongi TaxID=2712698 RepID=UPI00096B699C|nr:YqgE/AlgH family protein [Salaquimonas pukyongi]
MTQSSLEGRFLVAMPRMGDARFENTVVFVCAHSDEGAMGFVVNRPLAEPGMADFMAKLGIVTDSERTILRDSLKAKSLHMGGPVEPGRGFVLHSPDFHTQSTIDVNAEVCLTATLEILRAIATNKGPDRHLVALGYSGWSAGQLEEEIASNGWLVTQADPEIIFGGHNDTKYNRVMGAMGIDPALLSADTGHA